MPKQVPNDCLDIGTGTQSNLTAGRKEPVSCCVLLKQTICSDCLHDTIRTCLTAQVGMPQCLTYLPIYSAVACVQFFCRRNQSENDEVLSAHNHHQRQCDQIGRFLQFLGNKFSYKVAQIFVDFLATYLVNHLFFNKNKAVVVTFWTFFGTTWATYYFNIWSHWTRRQRRHRRPIKSCRLLHALPFLIMTSRVNNFSIANASHKSSAQVLGMKVIRLKPV